MRIKRGNEYLDSKVEKYLNKDNPQPLPWEQDRPMYNFMLRNVDREWKTHGSMDRTITKTVNCKLNGNIPKDKMQTYINDSRYYNNRDSNDWNSINKGDRVSPHKLSGQKGSKNNNNKKGQFQVV